MWTSTVFLLIILWNKNQKGKRNAILFFILWWYLLWRLLMFLQMSAKKGNFFVISIKSWNSSSKRLWKAIIVKSIILFWWFLPKQTKKLIKRMQFSTSSSVRERVKSLWHMRMHMIHSKLWGANYTSSISLVINKIWVFFFMDFKQRIVISQFHSS